MKQGVNGDGELLQDWYVEHDPVDIDCSHDGMTRQEFADECDINILLDRYEKTGVLNHYSRREPLYVDLTEGPQDLAGALEVLNRATEAFMTLPAKIRREFDQDPVQFVQFCEDRSNLDKLREWGLAPPAPAAGAISNPSQPVSSPAGENASAASSEAPK